jgi:hypothetical protein
MKQFLSAVFFHVGDWISYPMCKFDWAWLYPIYNKLMTWSSNLDTAGKIWKDE